MVEILTFKIGEEIFGLNVEKIKEIINADYDIYEVPKSPPLVIGIFQPREEILTAIDLKYYLYRIENNIRKLLCKKEKTEKDFENLKGKNFIICEFDKNIHACLVDDVKDIINIEDNEIKEPPSIVKFNQSNIVGLYKNNKTNELIQIIDF